MKVLLDEMWSQRISEELRRRGHDVVAVKERRDLLGRDDPIVLAVAQEEGRALVTENVQDVRPLTRQVIERGGSHHGVIFTDKQRFSRHGKRIVGRMVTALDALLLEDRDLTDQKVRLI